MNITRLLWTGPTRTTSPSNALPLSCLYLLANNKKTYNNKYTNVFTNTSSILLSPNYIIIIVIVTIITIIIIIIIIISYYVY